MAYDTESVTMPPISMPFFVAEAAADALAWSHRPLAEAVDRLRVGRGRIRLPEERRLGPDRPEADRLAAADRPAARIPCGGGYA